MIINIQNKKDLITIDLRTNQIRYLKDYEKRGEIVFINLSNDDIAGYLYLFNHDKTTFFKCLQEDILNNLGIKVYLNRFNILSYSNINNSEQIATT